MNMNRNIIAIIFSAVLICLSCNKFEGDQTVPAFISVDGIDVANNPNNSLSNYSGCFTSNIDAVQITVGNSQENHVLGVFTLPCRVPVLRSGQYNIKLKPVIKYNGIAATRNSYPFYRDIEIKDQTLEPDKCLELGNRTHHAENQARHGTCSVGSNGLVLFEEVDGHAFIVQLTNNPQKILQIAGKAIHTGNVEFVDGADVLKHGLQLWPL